MLSLGSVTNKEWYHSIPTEKDSNLSTRISLTFRVVTTFKNNVSGELKGQGSLYKDFNWPEKLGGTHVNHSD
jgi:hypothetical protein